MNNNFKDKLYTQMMSEASRVLKKILFEKEGLPAPDMSSIITKNDKLVDKYLLKLRDKFMERLNVMSAEEIKALNKDYIEESRMYTIFVYGMSSVMSLNESASHIRKPAQQIVSELKRMFKLENFQVVARDLTEIGVEDVHLFANKPANLITAMIVDYNNNKEAIDKYMKSVGYTLIRILDLPNDTVDGYWIYMVTYTPIERPDIRNKIDAEYLYHVSSPLNRESIKENGIIAKRREGIHGITYSERVYFLRYIENAYELIEKDFENNADIYIIDAQKT